jgi:hypothetical protein
VRRFDSSRGHLHRPRQADSAWLSETGVPEMPGVLVRCLPGILPE